MAKRTWRQTKEGMVEVIREAPSASSTPSIHGDIEPFKSPIDGTIVNTRAQLTAHNTRHGVSNDLDSLRAQTQKYLASRGQEQKNSKQERINTLIEMYDRASSPDFNRNTQYHEDNQLQ
jgi:hypothetical protein